jgi:hypothetical protein
MQSQLVDCPIESGNDRYDRSQAIFALDPWIKALSKETAEKEVQDTSCRGSGGVPPDFKKSPKIGGYRGLIHTTSAFSI